MNSEIEKEVQDLLRNRRYNALEIAKYNLLHARQNANFVAVEKELRLLELKNAKNYFKSQNEYEKYKQILIEKQNDILKSIGLSNESLMPSYSCQICQDKGFINGKQCKCYKNLLIAKLLEYSGISDKKLVSFKDFNENIAKTQNQTNQLVKYKNFLTEIVNAFPDQKTKCITVCGSTGTGKTFGSKCLATEILKKQFSVLFVSAFEFSSIMLKYHTAFIQDKNNIISTLIEPDLLIIDDLGTEPMLKKVTLEYLYVVLTERISQNKTTFITTNLSLSNILERYGERIFSRLTDKKLSKLIQLSGDDLRHIK